MVSVLDRRDTLSIGPLAATPDGRFVAAVRGEIVRLFDLQSGTSEDIDRLPADKSYYNLSNGSLAISADARYLTFLCNLSDRGTTICSRNRTTGVTTELHPSAGGDVEFYGIEGPGGFTVSSDGKLIAMQCASTSGHICVHDRDADVTIVHKPTFADRDLRVGRFGAANVNDAALDAAISGDGRFIAFPASEDVYRYDVATGKAIAISAGRDGRLAGYGNGVLGISHDGNRIMFGVGDDNQNPLAPERPDVGASCCTGAFVRDVSAKETYWVGHQLAVYSLAADGSAFAWRGLGAVGIVHIPVDDYLEIEIAGDRPSAVTIVGDDRAFAVSVNPSTAVLLDNEPHECERFESCLYLLERASR